MLKKQEKERNSFSYAEIYTHDQQENTGRVQSTIPSVFKDIESCHSSFSLITDIKPIVENPFILLPATKELLPPPGFPTLSSIKHFGKPAQINVNVFGRNSKSKSLFIIIEESNSNTEEKIKFALDNYVGKSCFAWPYNREVLVVGLSGYEKTFNFRKQSFSPKDQSTIFSKDAEYYESKWRGTKAVDIGKIDVLASIRPIIGVVRERDGYLRKLYSTVIERYPVSLLLQSSPTHIDHRFDTNHGVKKWEEEFPIGSNVICTQKGNLFGALCQVIGYKNDGNEKKKL